MDNIKSTSANVVRLSSRKKVLSMKSIALIVETLGGAKMIKLKKHKGRSPPYSHATKSQFTSGCMTDTWPFISNGSNSSRCLDN